MRQFILGTFLCLAPLPAFATAGSGLDCAQQSSIVELTVPGDGKPLVLPQISNGAWLEIEETGRTIDLQMEPAVNRTDIPWPPRYGRTFVDVTAHPRIFATAEPTRERVTLRIRARCAEGGFTSLEPWWSTIASISKQAKSPLSAAKADELLREAHKLATEAPDSSALALALHLVAQIDLAAQRVVSAAAAFDVARKAWQLAGDSNRAMAARVGATESLQRSGRYARILELVRMPSDAPATQNYYTIRIVNSRCLALHNLARRSEAAACYRWMLKQFDVLDERIDYVNALRNYADLQLAMGDSDGAMLSTNRAFALASGRYASLVRGRAKLTAADVSIARGDVHSAIAAIDVALENFTDANAVTWQGDAFLKAASTYSELGAFDEAYLAVRAAFDRYSTKDEPALSANALRVYARIERDNYRYDYALDALRAAMRVYRVLNMPEELESTRLALVSTQIKAGRIEEGQRMLAETQHPSPLNSNARALLSADIAIRSGRRAEARVQLDELKHRRMRLSEAIEFTRLDAAYWHAQYDDAHARDVLSTAIDGINNLAQATRNRALRLLLARQAIPIRSAAMATLVPEVAAGQVPEELSVDAEAIWSWLLQEASVDANSQMTTSGAERFDSAIALELLVPSPGSNENATSAQPIVLRELTALLAKSGAKTAIASNRPRTASLAYLQQSLAAGAALLAYLDCGERGAILYVTKDSAAVYAAESPSRIRLLTSHLRKELATTSTPVSMLESASKELSNALLRSMSNVAAPRKLLLLASEATEAMPSGFLFWPGTSEPLLTTTETSLVTVASTPYSDESSTPRQMYVAVANLSRSSRSVLPLLPGVDAEPDLIRAALEAQGIPVDVDRRISRPALLRMLAQPDAWVHVAAHGFTQPSRIGYSGIWIAGDAEAPDFLSWLDIIDHDAHAKLVVLNACQLGDSGTAVSDNLSFALGLSQAGVSQVVAALWPISDAASAVWVPAFYATLTSDSHYEASGALRAAQLELRKSRMFRHPFYWAGMQAFVRIALPANERHRPEPEGHRARIH